MAEEKNGKIVSTGKTTCACGPECSCGCGHHCAHRVLWWVLAIVILAVAFCVGVKAGEFREELHYMYGGSYYRAYPIMQPRVYGGGGVAVPVVGTQGVATGTTGGAVAN